MNKVLILFGLSVAFWYATEVWSRWNMPNPWVANGGIAVNDHLYGYNSVDTLTIHVVGVDEDLGIVTALNITPNGTFKIYLPLTGPSGMPAYKWNRIK